MYKALNYWVFGGFDGQGEIVARGNGGVCADGERRIGDGCPVGAAELHLSGRAGGDGLDDGGGRAGDIVVVGICLGGGGAAAEGLRHQAPEHEDKNSR